MTAAQRRGGKRLLLISVPIILAVTLLPMGSGSSPPFPCLTCGEHGTADALLNVILFIPVGVSLGLVGASGLRPYLLATALSAAIELAQILLPGRHASVGDVLFNAIGGAVGIWTAASLPAWRSRVSSPLARAGLATAFAAGIWTATGYLLEPAWPPPPYYGQWTPNLAPDQWYRGRVLAASLGRLTIDSARVVSAESVQVLFLEGAPLRVRAIAGPPSAFIAPLVRLHDAREREVVELAFHGHDIVLSYRTRAAALRLDQPDLRALPPRDIVPGDTIELAARRRPHGFTLEIGDAAPRQLGYTLGEGWALLLYIEEFPPWLKTLLNLCWIAGCVMVAGLGAVPRGAAVAAAAILLALLYVIPQATSLMPTPPLEFAAALGGLAAGPLARMVRRSQP